MKSTTIVLLVGLLGAAMPLAACGSTGGLSETADDTSDLATDAFGLPRARPGQAVIDSGDATVPTPYGGEGALRTCQTLAQDIARLTVVLGPDAEAERDDSDTDEDDGFASDLVQRAPDAVGDAATSVIVGLNPARPVVRFLGQAGEIEAAARRERELALKRRAWLRGAFDASACEADVLGEALEAYNLLETSPEE
ncbi:MAG: hypothetical protein AAFX09_12350 [Pseudomonadota bacterium]